MSDLQRQLGYANAANAAASQFTGQAQNAAAFGGQVPARYLPQPESKPLSQKQAILKEMKDLMSRYRSSEKYHRTEAAKSLLEAAKAKAVADLAANEIKRLTK